MAEHRIRDRRPNLIRGIGLAAGALRGFPFISSRAGGTITSIFGTGKEQEADDEFRERQEATAERLRSSLDVAFDNFQTQTDIVSQANLSASKKFFGSQRARFASVADPAIARADELAGEFGDIETEGRGLSERLTAGQRERETSLVAGQESRGADLIQRQGELGEAEVAEIIRQFQTAQGIQRGRLAGRGIAGTSVGASILESSTRGQASSVALARERLAREDIGLRERNDAINLRLRTEQSGQTLAQEAASGEFNLGLARDRIGQEQGALQFSTDLGLLGLTEEERALQNLQEDRTRFGLASAEAGIRKHEAVQFLETEGIVNTPPTSGRFRRSFALSGVKGKDVL